MRVVSWGFALWHALGFVIACVTIGFGRAALTDKELRPGQRYLWAFGLWTIGCAMWLKVFAEVMEAMP